MNPKLSALFAILLMEKWTGFPKRWFSPKRLFQIFFPFIQHSFFLVVSTSTLFVVDISVPCNSSVTQCFIETICIIVTWLSLFWLVAKIATSVFLQNFVTPFYISFSHLLIDSSLLYAGGTFCFFNFSFLLLFKGLFYFLDKN